jgi:hypothetical protein
VDYSRLEGSETALRAFEANTSPRFRYIDNLERWVEGRQYEGLKDWFDEAVSLWERAPCIVYLLTKGSIDSKKDLVVGEGHFPAITSSPDEDDEDFDKELGLGEDASRILDRFIQKAIEQSKLDKVLRDTIEQAQGSSSAVLLFGAREGRLFAETTKAKWCEPTFDKQRRCTRLEIRYPYLDPYKENGRWKVRTKIYRRVIDETEDATYFPVDAQESGKDPKPDDWRKNPELTVAHGLGICPVIWYAFMRGVSTVNNIDGNAVHDGKEDEIRALDQALSQRHRAVMFGADPQWTEHGVVPGYNPCSTPARVAIQSSVKGGDIGPNNPRTGSFLEPGSQLPARKKGPGQVWQYPDPNTKVEMHCLPGDAVKATMDHAGDLRIKLCELLAYVPLDPESIKGIRAISGKALTALRKREINRCNSIRDDFGDECIIPGVLMLLRIARILAARGAGALRIPGLKKVMPILQKFEKDDPDLRLVWGSYEDEDPEDEANTVNTTDVALKGGFITRRMAVQKVKQIFGIENVDQALETLEEEKQEAMEQEQELMGTMHELANGTNGRAGNKSGAGKHAAGGGENRKKTPGGSASVGSSSG